MSSTLNNIIVVLTFIASTVIPIIGIIIPAFNLYMHKEQLDLKAKERLKKIIFICLGVSVFLALIIFALASSWLFSQSSPPMGTLLYRFQEHRYNDVYSLTWSPDSSRIASGGSYDGTIQIWDAVTGNHLLTYQSPTTFVKSLSWSPDGKYIAAVIENHLSILEVDATILRRVFVLTSSLVAAGNSVVAWSPDGTRIALACEDHAIRVWNVTAGQINQKQKPLINKRHSDWIYSLAWSPDGQYIASASADSTIQIWNIGAGDTTYKSIFNISGGDETNLDSNVAWSPDGTHIVAEDSEGIVNVWNSETGEKQFSIPHSAV